MSFERLILNIFHETNIWLILNHFDQEENVSSISHCEFIAQIIVYPKMYLSGARTLCQLLSYDVLIYVIYTIDEVRVSPFNNKFMFLNNTNHAWSQIIQCNVAYIN